MTGKPLQIYLRPDQDQALRALAARQDKSLAELIRHGVDLVLSEIPPGDDPALNVIGLGRSGRSDLATEHDRHLARAARR
ncbi:MAG: CopG family transcriptional regulator [Thermodesulfobacteriota bacterium]